MVSNAEIDRLARYLRASTLAQSGDHTSAPQDHRQSLETVAFRLAVARGAQPAPFEPSSYCSPILWIDSWDDTGGETRAPLEQLLCLLHLHPLPPADLARSRRKAARARLRWRRFGRPRWRWSDDRKLLLIRSQELGLAPVEAMAALFRHRHEIRRWAGARRAYLVGAIEAGDLILNDARAGKVTIWGAPLGERLEFGKPQPIPVADLMQEVALRVKANAVAPIPSDHAQPWFSETRTEFRECFIERPDAEAMLARLGPPPAAAELPPWSKAGNYARDNRERARLALKAGGKRLSLRNIAAELSEMVCRDYNRTIKATSFERELRKSEVQ